MSQLHRLPAALLAVIALMLAVSFSGFTTNSVGAQGEAETATLTVAHFAPFADTIEGTSVDVLVNGEVAIPGFTYPEFVRGVELPEGDYLVQVALEGTDTIVISDTLSVMSGVDYTVAAIGGANGWTPEYYVLVNDLSAPSTEATGKVRISHLAPFADTEDGTRVDICTEDGAVVGGLIGVPYKASTDYLELPIGDYDLKVAATGSDCATLIDVPAFNLLDGEILDVFAVGDGVNQTPSIVVNDQTPKATVNVAHYAPFADTKPATSVTVRVDGADALTEVEFGDVANGIELDAGEHLVEVVPSGQETVAISATVNLASGGMYSVIAQGDGVNQDLNLKVLNDMTAAPASGQGKLRVGHLAPFAADPAATEVDICFDAGGVVPGLNNVPYDTVSPFLELPAGDYDFLIAVAGTNCATVALDLPSIQLSDGQISDAFAIGKVLDDDASDIKLQVSTILGVTATPNPATVNVAHYAPFADTADATSVTVRVDGADALKNVRFGDVANNISLDEGEHLVEILPSGTNTVAISATVNLAPGGMYSVIAQGDGVNQDLNLKVLDDMTAAPASGQGKLRVGHLAPFAADLADTEVDVCLDAGGVVPGLSNVPYDTVSPFLELPAGDYDFLIAVAGTDCATVALDLPSVQLSDGQVSDVFAIGKVLADDTSDIKLQASTILGLTFTPAPAPATVNVVHFAPFGDGSASAAGTNAINAASVTVRVDGVDALTNFMYREMQKGVELPAGDHLIQILPTGTETIAISETVTLAAAGDYTVIATGDGANQSLALKVLDNATDAPQGNKAKLRVGHLAPFAQDLDATRVDICTQTGSPVLGLTDVPYNVVTDFIELDEGRYDLKIALAGSNCEDEDVVLDVDAFALKAGDVSDIYAIGKATTGAFVLDVQSVTGLDFGTAIDDDIEPQAPVATDSFIFMPIVQGR